MKMSGSPADELYQLKLSLKKAKKGFRLAKYDIYQEVMVNVIRIKSDTNALKEFVERNEINRKKRHDPKRFWITQAAFTFVNNNEGLGWKGARVSEFLYDFKKVPIDQLAEQLRELGGIENIVKLAAKEDPRQSEASGGIKKQTKAASETKKGSVKSAPDVNDWHTVADDDGDQDPKDVKIAISLSPNLHSKLQAIEAGRCVKLIGVRAEEGGWADVMLEVQKVRLLKL